MVAEPQLFTALQFAQLPEQKALTELIDGEVIVSPTPTLRHQMIATRLSHPLISASEREELGMWVSSPVDLYLSPYNVYQPDMLFFETDHIPDLDLLPVTEIPSIVVEVLSPSSRSRDRIRKRSAYADRRIAEYWIVDSDNRRITLHFLTDDGTYVSQDIQGDVIPAGLFAGTRLDIEWIFGR